MGKKRKDDFDRIWEFARGTVGFKGDIFVDEDGDGFGEDGDHLDHYDHRKGAVYLSRRWENGRLKARHDYLYHFLHELAHARQHMRMAYAPLWKRSPSKTELKRLSLRMERDAARQAVRWARQLGVNVGHWFEDVAKGGDAVYPKGYLYLTLGIAKKGR